MQFYNAMVKAVPSGDCLVLLPIRSKQVIIDPKFEKTMFLSQADAPRVDKDENFERDELFAWGSREFMRKLCIGKAVVFCEESNFGTIILGRVVLGEENVALRAISKGWAKVRKNNININKAKLEQEKAAKLEQEKAMEDGLGLWNKAPDAAMESSRIRSELTIESLLAETPTNMNGIVETVLNGRTVRVLLIPHFHFVNVMVAGVQAFSTSLALESNWFTEAQVLHRDVKICVLRGTDKHNTIVGSVCYLGGDLEEKFLALELIKKSYAKYGDWSEHMMEANEKRKLKIADYEAREERSRVWKDYSPPPTALNRIRDQDLEGQVVQIVSGDHIIVAVAVADGTEQYYEVYLSSIKCPRLDGAGVKPLAYSNEAKEFVRAHLIGRQVLVELEYSRKPCKKTDTKYDYGSIFLENAHGSPSQNVSRLVVAEGLGTVCKHKDMEVVSKYYDDLCIAESQAICNQKGMHSGMDPPIKDITDLSNAKREEVGEFADHIFFWFCDDINQEKFEKVDAVVESVKSLDKIILRIENEKTWRIAFSLHGITWPIYESSYTNEAIQLLRRNIIQRRVEVELKTIDGDGCFVGILWESNTHVAIPLLRAGLAKLVHVWPTESELLSAENYAREKKLKIWENYVEPSYQAHYVS